VPDLPLARFRATIHYDGTAFRGWQLQPEERTVQREVESALFRLLSSERRVLAAGRTDTGVHAVGQEISFEAPTTWNAGDLRRGLNALLPDDVWTERLERTEPDFHPRYDAVSRRYEYLASDRPEGSSPILRGRVWDLGARRRPSVELNVGRLTEISGSILGEHSFAAFSKSGQPERGTRCTVQSAFWERSELELLHFTVVADRFLHRMVRYLVATVVEVAAGRRDPDDLLCLLAERDETEILGVPSDRTGTPTEGPRPPVPAPAWGLYLTGVRYAEGWNRPPGIPGIVRPDRAESVES
jgi:tRNA pseudouridine38-40 synthase